MQSTVQVTYSSGAAVKGLNTSTPRPSKSFTLRVTTTRRWMRAVAAIMASPLSSSDLPAISRAHSDLSEYLNSQAIEILHVASHDNQAMDASGGGDHGVSAQFVRLACHQSRPFTKYRAVQIGRASC